MAPPTKAPTRVVRLSEDVVRELEKRAEHEGKSIRDVAEEMILAHRPQPRGAAGLRYKCPLAGCRRVFSSSSSVCPVHGRLAVVA